MRLDISSISTESLSTSLATRRPLLSVLTSVAGALSTYGGKSGIAPKALTPEREMRLQPRKWGKEVVNAGARSSNRRIGGSGAGTEQAQALRARQGRQAAGSWRTDLAAAVAMAIAAGDRVIARNGLG